MQTTASEPQSKRAPAGRRGFLKGVSAVLLGAGALLTAPLAGLRAWLHPLRRSETPADGRWILVARLSALPDDNVPRRFPAVADHVNAWTRMPQQTVGAVYLRRSPGDATVQAFNVVCPHAGCLVDYAPEQKGFLCPCHDSRFTLDGRLENPGSPSPRGLDSLDTEVRQGEEVWVRFQNFRAGTQEKLPVG